MVAALRLCLCTCQTGANMWKASAMSSRIAMSSWAPRVRSTGSERKSINPDDLGDEVADDPFFCSSGFGKKRMSTAEMVVTTAETRTACPERIRSESRRGDGLRLSERF